ncbi:MAG: glycosyltransferase family 4 protein [Prochlorococcaceae cyanobacterium]
MFTPTLQRQPISWGFKAPLVPPAEVGRVLPLPRRSRSRRVTIFSQFFPPDFAATGQLLDDLTARLADRGLSLRVLTGQPAYAFREGSGARKQFETNRFIRRTRVSRLWPKRIRGRAVNGMIFCLWASLRMLRYALQGDLLLFTTEPAYLPVVGWLIHKLTGSPYLVLLYDIYPDVLVELKVLPERHWLVRLWRHLQRQAVRDAQEVIVLSEPMARRVERHCPEVRGRLAVLPSWADPSAIRPIPRAENHFVQEHQLTGTFNVLYSGNQGRCHDLVTLMAAALLLRKQSGIRFLFVGAGAQNERLQLLAREWGLSNCTFLPYQDQDTLPHSLTSADVAVVSLGIEAEGLVAPSKLYGHLAAGTPIAAIAPQGAELGQLVERHGCGRWFANGDAEALAAWIVNLRDEPALAQRYGAAARQLLLAEAHPDAIAERYLKLMNRHLPLAEQRRPLAACC